VGWGKFILLGFDIGGTKTAAVLGTPAGEIIARDEIATPAESFEAAFTGMVQMADRLLAAENIQPQAVSAAVGGPLDIERGIIYAPPHLPAWADAPLKDRLAAHYHLPVYVEHDGNAGALAEWYFGAGRGAQNMIYLTAGTGLGAGIILNGRIYRGSTDTAGEIGHIRLAEDGPLEYGKAGSWEGYCSGAGLVKLARLRQPQRWPEDTTTRDLVTLALAGEADAVQLVREMGTWLGKGLAILVDVLNPQAIVVGTLGVVLGDLLLGPAREVVRREALPRAADACRVVPAELGERLSSLGALMAAIDAIQRVRAQRKKSAIIPATEEPTMNSTIHACLVCERTDQQVPLIQLHYGGQSYWICPQDLPVLIHRPETLVGKLPGAEQLAPHEHEE
jgi:glucokinase